VGLQLSVSEIQVHIMSGITNFRCEHAVLVMTINEVKISRGGKVKVKATAHQIVALQYQQLENAIILFACIEYVDSLI